MGQIIVTALIAGAITGLASSIFASDGLLFTAVNDVVDRIVQALQNTSI